MVLTDTDIQKFQALYRSEFGMEISAEEAYEKGIRLVRLMSAVYRPITKEQFERIVTGIAIYQSDISYRLAMGTVDSWHYAFEITIEKNILQLTL